ncbi:MAG: hypothetical protein ACE37N_02320 [Pseudohongiellaceae bacterium]
MSFLRNTLYLSLTLPLGALLIACGGETASEPPAPSSQPALPPALPG